MKNAAYLIIKKDFIVSIVAGGKKALPVCKKRDKKKEFKKECIRRAEEREWWSMSLSMQNRIFKPIKFKLSFL